MSAKEAYLNFHGYTPGTPEAEEAWKRKRALDAGAFRRLAPLVFVKPDVRYASPIDGRPITSQAARVEDMKRSGCMEYEPGMRQDSDRRMKAEEEALDRKVDAFVEREIETMPTAKRERLAAELDGGSSPEVVRITPQQRSFRGA